MLMQRAKWSERDLAQKSGVSQKTINNMLNERTQPGLDNVQMVAEAFNLNLMHLISDTLEQDMNGGGTIAELTKHFVDSTPEGTDAILALASRETSEEGRVGKEGGQTGR